MLRRLFELFDRVMGAQWGCPKGIRGRLAAFLMERGNAVMNELAIEALDVGTGERVLEIGFGPGVTLERIAQVVGEGSVAGIDPSELMVRRASKRLQRHVEAGRASLRQGVSSQMPFEDASFGRALSVNTIYFWKDPHADLCETRRVLKAGGRFVLVFRGLEGESGRLEGHGMPEPRTVDDVAEWLAEAGFKCRVAAEQGGALRAANGHGGRISRDRRLVPTSVPTARSGRPSRRCRRRR